MSISMFCSRAGIPRNTTVSKHAQGQPLSLEIGEKFLDNAGYQ